MADSPLVACRHCATLHERVPIEPGALASCTRCGYALYRNSRVTPDGWIAIAVATLIVFAIANYFPIARLNIQGLSIQASLPGALLLTWPQGHEEIGRASWRERVCQLRVDLGGCCI